MMDLHIGFGFQQNGMHNYAILFAHLLLVHHGSMITDHV